MWPNPQGTADLVTFTGEILNRKLHFLCSAFTNSQSGFLHGDPCISQLLSIVHEIKLIIFLDCSPAIDVRGVFLDIPKAFDKVWHQGLIFKLKLYGAKGKLYKKLYKNITWKYFPKQ